MLISIFFFRGVAQAGSAPALGAGSRGFKSLRPDPFQLLNGLSFKNQFIFHDCDLNCVHLSFFIIHVFRIKLFKKTTIFSSVIFYIFGVPFVNH